LSTYIYRHTPYSLHIYIYIYPKYRHISFYLHIYIPLTICCISYRRHIVSSIYIYTYCCIRIILHVHNMCMIGGNTGSPVSLSHRLHMCTYYYMHICIYIYIYRFIMCMIGGYIASPVGIFYVYTCIHTAIHIYVNTFIICVWLVATPCHPSLHPIIYTCLHTAVYIYILTFILCSWMVATSHHLSVSSTTYIHTHNSRYAYIDVPNVYILYTSTNMTEKVNSLWQRHTTRQYLLLSTCMHMQLRHICTGYLYN